MKLLEELYAIREKHRLDGHEVSHIVLPAKEYERLQSDSNLPEYKGKLLIDGTPVVSGDVNDVTVKTEDFVYSG